MYAFAAVILFLLLYYIRPQEWVGVLKALSPVKMVMILGFLGLLARPGGITRRSILRTPHDWLMIAFICWMIYTADSWKYAFDKTGRQALGFYIVIVGALTTLQRINVFLLVWSAMIVLLSLFAVASLHGFDPMGSEYLTMVKMGGRLSVNTSIFNNPNALGHSVVPVLIMLYYQFVWKRPIFVREVAVVVMALPLYCLYLTQSKGAFVAGFVTILAGLTFGRSRYTQIFLIVFALTVGVGSLGHLPRMDTLSASDAGIQGRLVAFSHGLNAMMETQTGVGYGKWWDSIVMAKGSPIAAHSSYVRIGAELGYVGLFLYLGVMYMILRTLVFARTRNDDEERVRRVLFALLVSFGFSSWMINWEFRETYFMMAAVAAAFHRYLMVRGDPMGVEWAEESPAAEPDPGSTRVDPGGGPAGGWAPRPAFGGVTGGVVAPPMVPMVAAGAATMGGAGAGSPTAPADAAAAGGSPGGGGASVVEGELVDVEEEPAEIDTTRLSWEEEPEDQQSRFLFFTFWWNRLRIGDLLAMILLFSAAIRFWKFAITNLFK